MEQLLSTKFYIPVTRLELVSRPRLFERMNEGLHRKLTLVSAPAGFGKTTLVSEWLNGNTVEEEVEFEYKTTWLSLDESDNDPVRFLAYFISALNQAEGIEDALEEDALNMIYSPQPPATEAVLTSLINEITSINNRIVLVLDDYHLIDAQAVHDILLFLLENLPVQIHLIIATREDPPLSLPRLRARGQLTELRAADLRFTSSEAAEFLNQVMSLDLSAEDITALENRTEGWIAGLQMAALSMQGRADIASFIQAFTGSHRFVLDYLVEEVLQSQPEHVRSFLLQTSILEQLNGSLCDALTRQEDGKGMLEALERGNLFVVSLDDRREWYRYHHLFADVLQTHLVEKQPNQVANLHLRASEWFEKNDQPSGAIRHAIAADDLERAANLAELVWPTWSGSFQSIVWLGWVKALPDELVRARPVLSVCYAWAFLNAGELEAAEDRLLDAERWLDPAIDMSDRPEASTTEMVIIDEEQFRSLPISLAAARAYHSQAIGDVAGTVKYTQRILDLTPEGDHHERGTATALQGLAYWTNGDLDAAHQTFSDGLAGMKPLDVIVGTFVLADIKMTLGYLQEAINTCEHALQLAAEHGEPMPLGTEDVYSGISELHRERGDLEAAAQDLSKSKKLGDQVELPDWQYRWCIAQARLKESLGDFDTALNLLDEAESVFVRTPLPDVRPIAAMKTRVLIRQGRLTEAKRWARECNLAFDDELSYLREFEHITLARVLIAQYKSDQGEGSFPEVEQLLKRLLMAAEEGGRTRSVIEILVLQALTHEEQDSISLALESLDRALALAEPEGYCRIFVDEGSPMAGLLYEALSRRTGSDYVRELLAAFPTTEPENAIFAKPQSSSKGLVEPLSERELEVLQLIADGLTNQEIANRLFLSLNTVKVHTRNIYAKLDAHHRAGAVARAKKLGILSPN